MPNQRKQLGTALENTVVKQAKAVGLRSRRQPLSGVLADFPNDVEIEQLLVECKVRASRLDAKGKRMLSFDIDWLTGVQKHAKSHDYEAGVVVMRPKNSERLLAIMEWDFFLELLDRSTSLTRSKT